MTTVKIPYLCSDTDRFGNRRVYVRKNTRKIRINSAPGTPAFEKEYKAALMEIDPRTDITSLAKRKTSAIQMVYFIIAGPTRVKIGISRCPARRVRDLKSGQPNAKLYYGTPGDRSLERKLHSMFDEEHIKGEWFVFSRRIKDWISEDEKRRASEQNVYGTVPTQGIQVPTFGLSV